MRLEMLKSAIEREEKPDWLSVGVIDELIRIFGGCDVRQLRAEGQEPFPHMDMSGYEIT
jgi:hypothetical protein